MRVWDGLVFEDEEEDKTEIGRLRARSTNHRPDKSCTAAGLFSWLFIFFFRR